MEKTTKNIMNKNAKNKKKSIAEIMLLAMQSNKTKEFVSFATIFAVFFLYNYFEQFRCAHYLTIECTFFFKIF